MYCIKFQEFVSRLNLKPGQKVLDVGCGIGGSAFYMAKEFGVNVVGIDLSSNMINLALKRREEVGVSVEVVYLKSAFSSLKSYIKRGTSRYFKSVPMRIKTHKNNFLKD